MAYSLNGCSDSRSLSKIKEKCVSYFVDYYCHLPENNTKECINILLFARQLLKGCFAGKKGRIKDEKDKSGDS